jgi:hypothetical protein
VPTTKNQPLLPLDNCIEIPNAPAESGPRAGTAAGESSTSAAETSADAVLRADERDGDLAQCAAVSDGAGASRDGRNNPDPGW